jgi:hypothetical protein
VARENEEPKTKDLAAQGAAGYTDRCAALSNTPDAATLESANNSGSMVEEGLEDVQETEKMRALEFEHEGEQVSE